MSDGPISFRELGRRLNVSGEAISKAVQTGRISGKAVGHIELKGGRKRPAIIDPDLAIREWGARTDATQVRNKAKMKNAGRRQAAKRNGRPPPPDLPVDDDDLPDIPDSPGDGSPIGSINDSKRHEAAYKARLAKLEWEERSGKLVNAEQIKTLFSGQIVEARTKLLAVPNKARGRIPHLTATDALMLEAIIMEALESLSAGGNHGG